MGTGLAIILVSLDVISVEESAFNASKWVVGVCGFIFFLAGVMIFLEEKAKYTNLVGGILVLSIGIVGGWIAMFGNSDAFSGGLVIWVARGIFGFGALICLFGGLFIMKRHFKTGK
tara:strand:- start:9070 stop:9417 length:348 start_codon:yes stop_codon:yes gene_type:complete